MKSSVRPRAVARRLVLESLETRRLLASITGSVFADGNYNGRQDTGESVTQTATPFIDDNANGTLDAGELRTSVNANGAYSFAFLEDGTYPVRLSVPAGFQVTTPDGPAVVATGNDPARGPSFGVAATPAAGTLSGYQYRDEDASGTPSTGDLFASGLGTFFIDSNDNAVRDSGEPTATVSYPYGNFTFSGLADGTYTVRASGNSLGVTTPGTAAYRVALGNGSPQAATGLAFGFVKSVSAYAARVFFFVDSNANGTHDSGETYVGIGAAAYADLNNDGQRQPTEPTVQDNDAIGTLAGLPAGTYFIRGLGGSAYTTTSAGVLVTLPASPTPILIGTEVYLGFRKNPVPNSVTGTVYRDANSNGTRDGNESGVNTSPGIRVYLDANGNGVFDSDEINTVTDTAGAYTLVGPAGAATVRVVVPAGAYLQSSPANNAGRGVTLGGAAISGQDFGLVPLGGVYGIVYDDANANGTFDTGDTALVNTLVYVDLDNDSIPDPGEPSAFSSAIDGSYLIGGLRPGTYTVRQSLPSGYRAVNATAAGFTISGNYAYVTFADTNSGRASVRGTVYNDANGNGVKDSVEGGLQSLNVWDDSDNDGKLDPEEQQTTTDADGNYALAGLPAGTFHLRALVFPNQTQTTPGTNGYTITLAANETRTGLNFGVRDYRPGTLGGYVFDDTNQNGTKDDGESGIAGVYAFIDYNRDGKLSSNDVVMKTDATGYWFTSLTGDSSSYRIAFYNQTGRPLTTAAYYDVVPRAGRITTGLNFGLAPAVVPTVGSLSGFVFDDTDKDGVYDANESKTSGKTVFLDLDGDGLLDANEKSVKTGTGGTWSFTGLAVGAYHVRRVFPTGYSMSTAPVDVTLAAGQMISGLAIGSRTGSSTPTDPKTAGISGTAFNDTNKNGKYDTGDTVAGGKTVWLDLDDDGVKDANETSVTTAGNGTFTFKNLAAGKYHVRRLFSTGYVESTAARYVTLTSGQTASGVLIGSKAK